MDLISAFNLSLEVVEHRQLLLVLITPSDLIAVFAPGAVGWRWAQRRSLALDHFLELLADRARNRRSTGSAPAFASDLPNAGGLRVQSLFVLSELVEEADDVRMLVDPFVDFSLGNRRGRCLRLGLVGPLRLEPGLCLSFLRLDFQEIPPDVSQVFHRIFVAGAPVFRGHPTRPFRQGSSGFAAAPSTFSVYCLLDLLELVVPVRSPFDVHVDDFFHVGFLDRVDDARELFGIVAAQGDFHHLRARRGIRLSDSPGARKWDRPAYESCDTC